MQDWPAATHLCGAVAQLGLDVVPLGALPLRPLVHGMVLSHGPLLLSLLLLPLMLLPLMLLLELPLAVLLRSAACCKPGECCAAQRPRRLVLLQRFNETQASAASTAVHQSRCQATAIAGLQRSPTCGGGSGGGGRESVAGTDRCWAVSCRSSTRPCQQHRQTSSASAEGQSPCAIGSRPSTCLAGRVDSLFFVVIGAANEGGCWGSSSVHATPWHLSANERQAARGRYQLAAADHRCSSRIAQPAPLLRRPQGLFGREVWRPRRPSR